MTGKGCYLTTTELHRLDIAVTPLAAMGHGVYLVGSVGERPDFRDVDVRLILGDDEFDALFGHSPELWSVFCYAVSRWLGADTDLPIDFQVQRQTEANEKHAGPRNHLGHRASNAMFAGRGDATRFIPPAGVEPDTEEQRPPDDTDAPEPCGHCTSWREIEPGIVVCRRAEAGMCPSMVGPLGVAGVEPDGTR